MKRVIGMLALLLALCVLTACGQNAAPLNGVVEFYDISLNIPADYARNTEKSGEDMWVFDKGSDDRDIVISCNAVEGEAETMLDNYVQYMQSLQTDSNRTTVSGCNGVRTSYTQDGVLCQEMLFIYKDTVYTIALRGDTQATFDAILATVTAGG